MANYIHSFTYGFIVFLKLQESTNYPPLPSPPAQNYPCPASASLPPPLLWQYITKETKVRKEQKKHTHIRNIFYKNYIKIFVKNE